MELKKHKNLSVVTNSISVAIELGAHPTFRVLLLGGDINAQYSFTYGTDAQEQLKKYRADYAILSMDGICPNGITTYHAEEARMDLLMIERSKQTIIAAESRKNWPGGLFPCLRRSHVDCLVTDSGADPAIAAKLRGLGIDFKFCV